MELIGITHLQAGYVLAADIKNTSGALLCPKGLVINEDMVERFRREVLLAAKLQHPHVVPVHTAGEVDGIPISATSTGIGCPSAAICVEELARVGAEVFIRVGTAGSLQEHVGLGHLVITTGAVREEGTSRQYVPLSYPAVADMGVAAALVEAAQKLGFAHHAGIGHCKDAFYAEFSEGQPMSEEWDRRWKVWQRSGVLATSMESAAIFVLSSIKGLRAGEVLAVVGLAYKDHPVLEAKRGIEEAIQVAIEAVKILEGRT